MKKIDKFVLKAYLGPMVLTFFIVMFVLMMNFVWRYIDEMVGKGLGFGVIVELLCYSMANMVPLGLPLATLLAAIMTMGNLGEHYELQAMKSAGMSLPRILRPLLVVVFFVSVASFFVANNLVPYANKRMFAIIYDIRQQKQELEFKDGIFFNGIDNMSIRVEHQDPKTTLLTGVQIYDTRNTNGNMTTTVADSGYIKLSDDKKFLLVTLYNGETYETTRNYQWKDDNVLRHHIFARQTGSIPMSGFDFERTNSDLFSGSQTKTIAELGVDIDSLDNLSKVNTARSYEPFLKNFLLQKDPDAMGLLDSIPKSYGYKRQVNMLDSLNKATIYQKRDIYASARSSARNSRNSLTFNEESAKENLNQLYRSKVEWHRKISLPVSVMIFFLIGAPLGAIIRRGGLAVPIVISVLFFVFYYIITIAGEKLTKEGTWDAVAGMWLSTFVLFPIAMYLTYKATNDSNLLNIEWYIMKYKKIKERVKGMFKKKSSKTAQI